MPLKPAFFTHQTFMPKIIFITGASSGLGRALAEQLHREGHIVYGTSRSKQAALPYRMLVMDVRDEDSVNHAINEVVAEHGRIDWLFNNAGVGMAAPAEQMQMSSAEKVMDTNVLGLLRVTKAVLPVMRQNGGGKIINISSIGSVVGLPFRGVYCASKASVDIITESLRLEVGHFGIQVCSIRAGDIRTNINRHRINEYDPGEEAYRERFEQTYQTIEKEVEKGISPQDAAQYIIRIAHKKQLRAHYNIGWAVQKLGIVVRRFAPYRFYEWALKQYLN